MGLQQLIPFDLSLLVFAYHTKPIISFQLWRMFGGSVWIWMKSNPVWFIEDQTCFSTSWHAKMSLNLNEVI